MTEQATGFTGGVQPKLKLVGEDGNAFFIIGRARMAARKAGVSSEEIEEFTHEAMSGDYDHVLRTCMDYFDVR